MPPPSPPLALLLAALNRDAERLMELLPRVLTCPLGSGALAGNAFGVDRVTIAKELGFISGPTSNSLDAVSDRDFVAEFLFWSAMTLTHVSQFAEDVIGQNLRKEVIISDLYATGSSLMPQKKNPDALELLRGKTGIAIGNVTAFLCTLKGLPRSYNKDLQEDKGLLFPSLSTTMDCLDILEGVLRTMEVDEKVLNASMTADLLATDLADYLVRRGVPFRETHHISGKVVRVAGEKGVAINELTLPQMQEIDARFGEDVMDVWSYEVSVQRKEAIGGTGLASVSKQIADLDAEVERLGVVGGERERGIGGGLLTHILDSA